MSEQPKAVQDAFEAAGIDWKGGVYRSLGDRKPSPMTGKDAYDKLAKRSMGSSMDGQIGQRRASEKLGELGIPGIKYLDQGSRAAGDGTRNFVIFSGDTAKILKRD